MAINIRPIVVTAGLTAPNQVLAHETLLAHTSHASMVAALGVALALLVAAFGHRARRGGADGSSR